MHPADLPLEDRLRAALELQRQAQRAHPAPTLQERRADLLALQRFLRQHRDALVEAICADYGHRSPHETLLCDIAPAVDAIGHDLKHLAQWMRPQRRAVDWLNFPGARNRVVPQPLGVVGVIVPWNFPVYLSFVPLSAIFAAGNRALVKFSENSRHLAALLARELPRVFPPEKLQVFDETGGVGQAFSRLPLDHLLFTGSGSTGRAVMAAAAQHLVPVTLELGGKSPAVVAADFPLRAAAERILFVKCLNAGQICTSVDHAWLPRAALAGFVEEARRIVPARYPAGLASPDLTAIVDRRSFARLTAALDEARDGGATVVPLLPGPPFDAASRKIAPHIVLDAPARCALATREIFGPILPLRGYDDLEEVIEAVNAGDRPLALYPFSHDRAVVQRLIDRTASGGVCVNDALWHVAQHDLPFGGVGASGMGHYHGREGFQTFSKLRPVFEQSRWPATRWLAPPYGRLLQLVVRRMLGRSGPGT